MHPEAALYRALLDLYVQDGVDPVLDRVLPPIVEATGARQAYVELHGPDGERRFWRAWDCDEGDIARIKALVSQGIIAETIARQETIHLRSARQDPVFGRRESVRRKQIEEVICAPIGSPPCGVLYLQGRVVPSDDGPTLGTYDDEHRHLVEDAARCLGPLVQVLLSRAERAQDHCAPYRRTLVCDRLVGHSTALARVLQGIATYAPLQHLDVLITGPSGTGKTLVARVLHDNSPRAGRKFVPQNCANFHPDHFERDLFGAEAGAYTGQQGEVRGLVAEAEGGTLFLDEVGELGPLQQAKLLTFIEDKTYRKMGSPREHKADVRVILATHRDLEHMDGFRHDLLFRFGGFQITVPPLSERRTDVPELARTLIARFARDQELVTLPLSPAAERLLLSHDWPGNVRELGHVVQNGLIRATAEGATEIASRHLFGAKAPQAATTWAEQTAAFHRRLLADALEATGWNISETERRLDLARSRIYELIAAFDLRRPERRA